MLCLLPSRAIGTPHFSPPFGIVLHRSGGVSERLVLLVVALEFDICLPSLVLFVSQASPAVFLRVVLHIANRDFVLLVALRADVFLFFSVGVLHSVV